jgi:hypothetical protein
VTITARLTDVFEVTARPQAPTTGSTQRWTLGGGVGTRRPRRRSCRSTSLGEPIALSHNRRRIAGPRAHPRYSVTATKVAEVRDSRLPNDARGQLIGGRQPAADGKCTDITARKRQMPASTTNTVFRCAQQRGVQPHNVGAQSLVTETTTTRALTATIKRSATDVDGARVPSRAPCVRRPAAVSVSARITSSTLPHRGPAAGLFWWAAARTGETGDIQGGAAPWWPPTSTASTNWPCRWTCC